MTSLPAQDLETEMNAAPIRSDVKRLFLPRTGLSFFCETKTKALISRSTPRSRLSCNVRWFNITWLKKMHMLSTAIKMEHTAKSVRTNSVLDENDNTSAGRKLYRYSNIQIQIKTN